MMAERGSPFLQQNAAQMKSVQSMVRRQRCRGDDIAEEEEEADIDAVEGMSSAIDCIFHRFERSWIGSRFSRPKWPPLRMQIYKMRKCLTH